MQQHWSKQELETYWSFSSDELSGAGRVDCFGLGAAILPKSKLQSSERKTYVLTNHTGKELTLDFEAVWLNTPQRPVHFQQFTDFLAGYREDL